MAIRGTEAKNYVTKKIQEAFGPSFLGIVDKKLYVSVKENGENLQVAISLTCPKENLEFAVNDATQNGGAVSSQNGGAGSAHFTAKEIETIGELMKRVGL